MIMHYHFEWLISETVLRLNFLPLMLSQHNLLTTILKRTFNSGHYGRYWGMPQHATTVFFGLQPETIQTASPVQSQVGFAWATVGTVGIAFQSHSGLPRSSRSGHWFTHFLSTWVGMGSVGLPIQIPHGPHMGLLSANCKTSSATCNNYKKFDRNFARISC